MNENNTDTTNTASLGWSFTLADNDRCCSRWRRARPLPRSIPSPIDDHHGGTVTQDVTVTITGTNDAPTIISGVATATGGVTEDTNARRA